MKFILLLIVFGFLNFGALALGGLFTGSGVTSEWYANLNKAPWTPPGWVFGAAWSLIMLCFTYFMAQVWQASGEKTSLIALFAVQWALNVGWNPTFFYFHASGAALLIIIGLTLLVLYLIIHYRSPFPSHIWLLAPYFIWLCIATSLNAYIYVRN